MNKYYTDIKDLPLRNWREITENSDLRYTRLDINEGSVKQDVKHDEIIQDTYLKEFGLTPGYLRIIELKNEIADAECDLVIEGDNFIKNRIKRLRRELEDLEKRNVGGDMDECIHYIEVWRKIEIDEDKMKTKKFFKLVRTYQKEASERKKAS